MRLAGVEPATRGFVGRYSIQLSYRRIKNKLSGPIARQNPSDFGEASPRLAKLCLAAEADYRRRKTIGAKD